MNLIFFGTSEFAVPALETLIAASCMPTLVVTLPDRPRGRGLNLLPSPVKVAAEKHGIPVTQPEKMSDEGFLKTLSETEWDIGVVAAYGKLIPQRVIALPKKGFLNIHPSLLPELRGPSPIQYAILEGKQKTGVTVMHLDADMDHGPVLIQEDVAMEARDTSESLGARCAIRGAALLAQALPKWYSGTLRAKPQDHSKATFSKKIGKEDGRINWTESVIILDRKIRAFQPWPGAYTVWERDGKLMRLKITEALPEHDALSKTPGLVEKEKNDMIIRSHDGLLRVQKIQPESKKIMSGNQFLNGYPEIIGSVLK